MTDSVGELQTRIAMLEQETAELKRTLSRMFTVLDVSTAKEPFLRLMISLDASETQESAVYELMTELDRQISAGNTTTDHQEFCNRVHQIFPDRQPQPLAEAIVTRLAPDGGWDQVYQHLRQSGMHLPDLRETRGF